MTAGITKKIIMKIEADDMNLFPYDKILPAKQ